MRAFCDEVERKKEEGLIRTSSKDEGRWMQREETDVCLSNDVLPTIGKHTRRERRSSSEQSSSFGPGEGVRCEIGEGRGRQSIRSSEKRKKTEEE